MRAPHSQELGAPECFSVVSARVELKLTAVLMLTPKPSYVVSVAVAVALGEGGFDVL